MAKTKKKKRRIFTKRKFQKFISGIKSKREKEYSKRLLNKIVANSILMLWATYGLAYLGREEIAETLAKTIVTSIIAIVVGYLVKSVCEKMSTYTTAFGENISYEIPEPDSESGANVGEDMDEETNMNSDC